MSFEIWIDTASAAGGYGGWSYVAFGGPEPRGVAGGDRRTTPVRMALTAAIAALEGLAADKAAPVRLLSRELAAGSVPEPTEDRDLWDKLDKLQAARSAPAAFAPLPQTDKARADFVHGWAAFALDIAKTKGAFSSQIPKPNLRALVSKAG
jgi:hypothetical protein